MSKGSAPPPPDYAGAAQATAAGNLEAAKYATEANRVDQYSPWGSTTWDKTTDPTTGGTKWSQTTNVTPELQQALDAQINSQNQRSQLADSLLGRLQSSFGSDFNAPKFDSYLNNVQGLDQTQYKASDYTSGVPGLNYDTPTADGYFKNVQALDQNAPTLSAADRQKYADAAFNSADAMLSRSYGRDEQNLRDSLALQGLNPMSQAANQATSSFYDSKNAAYNQLANQSLLTGDQMANADLASNLGSFNATNAARGQAYGQANQSFANGLQQYAAQNAVRQQGYTNALTNMGADMQSQSAANTARNQAYANALNKYQTDYTAAMQKRDLPLNEMNALLQGQQVSMPQFQGYATQATTGGPDLLNAVSQGYNAQVGAVNAQNAASASTTGSALGAAGTVAAAFFL